LFLVICISNAFVCVNIEVLYIPVIINNIQI